jgi:hypothetical protein
MTPCPDLCRFNLVGEVGQNLGCACKDREMCPTGEGVWLFPDEEAMAFREGIYYGSIVKEWL